MNYVVITVTVFISTDAYWNNITITVTVFMSQELEP